MRRKGVKVVAEGKWLSLGMIEYTAHDGTTRTWESVSRRNGRGAVGILATLKPTNEIVLIRQYRPPVDNYVIEFPAGLIDDGETPADTAVRELREETGFIGKVTGISPKSFSSPGLTSEYIYLASMEVDLDAQKEVRTDFDEGEFVETFRVSQDQLGAFLEKASAAGDVIDSKIMAYVCAKGIALNI